MSETLHYVERPASARARGLLLLLHGVGANEHSLTAVAAEQDPDIHVVVPRGPESLGPFAHGWFEVSFTHSGPVINAEQAESSRRLLIEFISAQRERLGLDRAHTVTAGFSQGGIMSASVALTSPESVSGFAILSGRILPEIDPLIPADIGERGLRALITHGLHDNKLPHFLAERSRERLRTLGVEHELLSYEDDHVLSPAMRRDFKRWVNTTIAH